jgi:hypothetical protein
VGKFAEENYFHPKIGMSANDGRCPGGQPLIFYKYPLVTVDFTCTICSRLGVLLLHSDLDGG